MALLTPQCHQSWAPVGKKIVLLLKPQIELGLAVVIVGNLAEILELTPDFLRPSPGCMPKKGEVWMRLGALFGENCAR
jgi:hypothetical protein